MRQESLRSPISDTRWTVRSPQQQYLSLYERTLRTTTDSPLTMATIRQALKLNDHSMTGHSAIQFSCKLKLSIPSQSDHLKFTANRVRARYWYYPTRTNLKQENRLLSTLPIPDQTLPGPESREVLLGGTVPQQKGAPFSWPEQAWYLYYSTCGCARGFPHYDWVTIILP